MESITRELRKFAIKHIYFHPIKIEEEEILSKLKDIVIDKEMLKDGINEELKEFILDSECAVCLGIYRLPVVKCL